MFRYGFRVSEACRLRLDQVDTQSRVLHLVRLKHGSSTTQPLRGNELKGISAWLKERARMKPTGKAFFVSEQRKPLHRSTVNLALRKYSKAAALPFLAHPHMLRHACGFALADQGADNLHGRGSLMRPLNQAGYMTATVLLQLGQEGLARERGPYMTDLGNAAWLDAAVLCACGWHALLNDYHCTARRFPAACAVRTRSSPAPLSTPARHAGLATEPRFPRATPDRRKISMESPES